ncbi:polysaccharide biosynthesis tyrosine autokinase [Litoribacter ruber]|uniref:non-specific protein-tyrosine kinase n=1 Tax=Litoribacter ruber TaxID=702568 RepID=A0AAP2CES5_9BACT|nr:MULTISPECIES: tyrosine-protein kinase family protein [Litoribacter]MBS9523183.1 polysaccharide biosynthesis tyrosine autokinase [Litoribacter alkaliphilus]MBT0810654.1 polysaccharide biosynthesis tyrosine autokinase [Litoribacter ruber]
MRNNFQNNSSGNPFESSGDGYDFQALLKKFMAKWYLFLIFPALGFGITYIVNDILFSQYRVESSVLIGDFGKENMNSVLFENFGPQTGTNLENEIGILSSFGLHARTLQGLDFNVSISEKNLLGDELDLYRAGPVNVNLDLNKPYVANATLILSVTDEGVFLETEGESYTIYNPVSKTYSYNDGKLKTKLKDGVPSSTPFGSLTFSIIDQQFRGELIVRFRPTHDLVLDYLHAVSFAEPLNESTIIKLSMVSSSPEKAKVYLSALMNQYIQEELDQANQTAENIVNFIDSQLTGITDSLNHIENRLENYRTNNQIFDLSSEGASIYGRLADLEQEKAILDMNLRYYNTLNEYVQEEKFEELMVPSLAGVTEPVLNQLVSKVLEQQGKLSTLRLALTKDNSRLKNEEEKLRIVIRSLKENLKNLLINTKAQSGDLERRIAKVNAEVSSLPATERRLLSIQRKFTINEGIYNYLLQRRAESAISKAATKSQNNILDEPRIMETVFPKRQHNLAIGIIAGLMIPGLFIFLKDFFRTKVESISDVKKYFSFPVIGNVPKSKVNGELAVYNFPKSHVTESYRSIRANFKYLFPERDMKTIYVTSAQPKDGKTFTAVNLASIFALSGKKTVIVGVDLRKPRLHESFNMSNKVGLTSYLIGQNSYEEVVTATEYENLYVVLAGPIPPNPAELILTQKFRTFVAALHEQFDTIIFDTPPMGVVAETLDIMSLCDAGLFVVRQNQTSLEAMEACKDTLDKTNSPALYIVYNDCDDVRSGYASGYYGDESESKSKKLIKDPA